MQRLIEAHGHEEEFSQSKLIDEDKTLKLELENMKVHPPKLFLNHLTTAFINRMDWLESTVNHRLVAALR